MKLLFPFWRSSRRPTVGIAITAVAFGAIATATGGCQTAPSDQNARATRVASPSAAVTDPAINAQIQAQIQQGAAAGSAEVAAHRNSGTAGTATH